MEQIAIELLYFNRPPVSTAVINGIHICTVSTGLTTFSPRRVSASISTFAFLELFARPRRLPTSATPSIGISKFPVSRLCSLSVIFLILEVRWNHCFGGPGVHSVCDHIPKRRMNLISCCKSIINLQTGILLNNIRGSDYGAIVF